MHIPATPSRRRARDGAFSLIELTLVVVIAGMLAAIAVPRYANSLARYRADAAAQRVVGDLNHARAFAAARSKAVTVSFFPAAEQYTLAGIEELDHPGQTAITRLNEDPYGADLLSADFAGQPLVTFDGFGQPSAGGTITLAAGPRTLTITVDPDTGRASTP